MVTKSEQVYQCAVCGARVKVLEPGAGELTCCDEPMKLIESIELEDEKLEQ